MKFEDRIQKEEKKERKNKTIRNILNKTLSKPYMKISDWSYDRKIRRDLKNIEKIKEKALKEIIEKTERDVLFFDENRVYKDAHFDDSTLSVKRLIEDPFSSLKMCRRYKLLMFKEKNEIDLDYFYYGTMNHFQKYEDLIVTEEISRDWEINSNIVRDLEYINILRPQNQ